MYAGLVADLGLRLRFTRLSTGLALLVWPLVAMQQWPYLTMPPERLGSIEATIVGNTTIQIKRGRQEWHVDLPRLIRVIDCAQRWKPGGGDNCKGLPTAPCLECPRLPPQIVTWDEPHQRLYFAITTMASWEKPFTLFRYSLATSRTERLINTWAGGLELGTVSSNGQYLAYLKGHHTAPAGGCAYDSAISTDIEIVNLWTHTTAKPPLALPNSDDVFFVDKFEWMSPSTLGCVVSRHRKDCSIIVGSQPVRLQVDMRSLQFR